MGCKFSSPLVVQIHKKDFIMTDKVILKFYWSKACFPGYDQVTDEFRNPKHSMYDIEWVVMMGSIKP